MFAIVSCGSTDFTSSEQAGKPSRNLDHSPAPDGDIAVSPPAPEPDGVEPQIILGGQSQSPAEIPSNEELKQSILGAQNVEIIIYYVSGVTPTSAALQELRQLQSENLQLSANVINQLTSSQPCINQGSQYTSLGNGTYHFREEVSGSFKDYTWLCGG